MTVDTKRVSNQEVIPLLKNETVFSGNPDARFALGFVSHDAQHASDLDELFRAYLKLRANVYIDQANLLDESYRHDDGTEVDDDDRRASHIVALENRLSHVAIVGSMRVIKKSEQHASPLPYEQTFAQEVPIGGNEISRYINRIDDRHAAAEIRTGLFVAALALIHSQNMSPTVAIVEPVLENRLQRGGVPLIRSAEPQMIEKYGDLNVGITIDTAGLIETLGGSEALRNVNMDPGQFVYWGQVQR
jgi:N-acyl-L-homoserine lactone synthetase